MFGILLVAHGDLGNNFLDTAIKILQESPEGIESFSIPWECDFSEIKNKLKAKVLNLLENYGSLLILTDLFGGTPTNLSMTLYNKSKVEILTGVNLPIIIKAIILQKSGTSLEEVLNELKIKGQEAIILVSEIYGVSE